MKLHGIFALSFSLATLAPAAAAAQGLSLPLGAAPSTPSPYGVPVKRVNNLDTAPITFEGQRLFTIGAPLALDNGAVPPIVQRVYTISADLREIVPASALIKGSRFDANTFKVQIGNENGHPILYATDAIKRENAPIMTITAADATVNGLSKEELAIEWEGILQNALGRAILAAQPAYMREQLRKVPFVLLGGALATLLLIWLRRRLRATAKAAPPERRTLYANLLWLAGFVGAVIWAGIVYWLMTLFQVTRTYANQLSGSFLEVAILWICVAVLDRALGLLIERVAAAWASNILLTPDQRARIKLRSPTLVRSAENLKSLLLWAIAILWTFSILSASAVSVLTIGAIAAFALSFAAQSLIKDYLNGFLILAEDQYAIGDYVTIGSTSGIVEDLTLRITRIRTDEGRLVTIANSTVTSVENATRFWARVDFRIAIAGSSNVDRAIAVLQETLDTLAADERWSKTIIEPPKVLGVDAISHAGIVLRAWIKTAPTERAPVAREVNRRVEEAFRRAGIGVGVPQTLFTQTPNRTESRTTRPQTP